MLVFIARRLFVSVWVFLAASAVMFSLAARVGDPLSEARQLPDINAQQAQMDLITRRLNLDEPLAVRYFLWLRDALTGNLGMAADGRDVNALLGSAFTATLQLVVAATVLSIVLGITIGVISALRQYSALDQTVTFAAFVFYSLPVFWVGTLLKQYVAIDLNNWLADPTLSWTVILGISALVGLGCASLLLADNRTKLITFGSTAGVMTLVLWLTSVSGWWADPGLGIGVIALTALAGAIGFTTLTAGLEWRSPTMYAALSAAGLGVLAALVLGGVMEDPTIGLLALFALLTAGICFALGWFVGGTLHRRTAIPAAMLTGLFVGSVIFVDAMLQNFLSYSDSVRGRPVATIGSRTPNYDGDFWQMSWDAYGHLALPTMALLLISLATYTRYTRASMLEVMNQDYVRTARAKGLGERAVVTRHVLRNGLIPITTLAAYDIGTVISGAVVTERVFGWQAMGSLLITGIENGDPMPIMAFFLVTGGAIVIFNMVADIAYAFLDPRIRLS